MCKSCHDDLFVLGMQQHALPKRGQGKQGPDVRLQKLRLQTGEMINQILNLLIVIFTFV